MALNRLIPQNIKNLKHLINSKIWNAYYRNPSKDLRVIGVTGTDGKTTTSTIIYNILQAADKKVALITTIAAKIGDKDIDTGFHVTNPTPRPLQKLLREIADKGFEYVVLETTSHGLDQYRVGGVQYDAAVYTNVTHEHLDYHKTYANYLGTKGKLITLLDGDGVAILNKDDESYEYLSKHASLLNKKFYSYSIEDQADFIGENLNEVNATTHFTVKNAGEQFECQVMLPGRYNVYNSLAAIALAKHFGISSEQIQKGISSTHYLEGRWEIMQQTPVKVVVDFAHTPNALEKVLTFARTDNPKGKVIVVFGCAGKRDIQKRPMMGEIADRLADITVLTAEDPRGEKVEDINDQIIEGMKSEDPLVYSVPDRGEAIEFAIDQAQPGDTVIVTGKGHEKSMNLDGRTETLWSDQLAIKRLLNLD